MPPVPLRRAPRRGHLIVCGDGPLARRLVEELTTRYGENVAVVVGSKKSRDAREMAGLSGAYLVEAGYLDEEALAAANVHSARALALVRQDDVGNIHAALRARELNPHVRLVLHVFNTRLGRLVSSMFGDCACLSDSEVAAPSFVAAAMGDELTPNHVRVAGRTVFAARTAEVRLRRNRVLCPLAVSSPDGVPRLLPPDGDPADVVLAVADGTPRDPLRRSPVRRRLTAARLRLRSLFSGRLRASVLAMVLLVVLGTVLFARSGPNSWADAIYLTLLDLAGAADPNTSLGGVAKVTQVLVTVVGIAIIPLLTAAIVDSVVRARLQASGGRGRVPYSGHVVVVGLGNVGTRVVLRLHDLGLPVVCVESKEDATGIVVARRLGIPVVYGDATREETLQTASVATCRAMLAVTSDDIANLEAGLHARELRNDLRLVLRVTDDDLAERIQREFDINISRSVAYLAAPAFAAAMLQREVVGTIPVGRHVLLLADVPVHERSPLHGCRIGELHMPEEARVIAVRRHGEQALDWSPEGGYELSAEDELFVVATRAGLGQVMASSIPDAD